jgi:hypothetical protein
LTHWMTIMTIVVRTGVMTIDQEESFDKTSLWKVHYRREEGNGGGRVRPIVAICKCKCSRWSSLPVRTLLLS